MMPAHEWPHRRQFDFVVLADQRPVGLFAEQQAATGAMRRRMILKGVGIFAEAARVTFMPGLGAAGLGVLALLLAIGGRRLRGSARRLVRALQTQHHLDQFVLAEPLQVIAIHPILESANVRARKSRPVRGKRAWVVTFQRASHPGAGGVLPAVRDLYFALTSASGLWSMEEIASWRRAEGLTVLKAIQFPSLPGWILVPASK